MTKSDFFSSLSQLPHTQRYIREYFCELLGSIILCMLGLGFVALAIIWVLHSYGKFIPLPSLNREHYHAL